MPNTTGGSLAMPNKLYNALKYTAQIGLPAVQVAYAGLAALWGFPHVVETVGSIAIVNTLLGSLVGVSSASYNASDAKYDGQLVVGQTPTGDTTHQIVYNTMPDLSDKSTVTLKVAAATTPAAMDPRLITPTNPPTS